MSNIPGAPGVIPGAYTSVETQTSGVAVPGGTRLAAILGEGARSEIIVSAALGKGADGFNPTYTSSSGADGRHFTLSTFPLISNRTTLFRNGSALVGLESLISTAAFDNSYDYRVDPVTGRIEMQKAYLVDQGGAFYTAGTQNVGNGQIQNLSIIDPNAPTETWTIKCASVQRDGYGVPMINTAKFIAFGTVSGSKLDGYGNPIIWLSNNVTISNGTVAFSVYQNPLLGSGIFKEGDLFTVQVRSGVLLQNDSLTSTYIGVTDINDPTFFDSMSALTKKHGLPSTSNNLALGSSLAFANTTPGVVALQTAPSVPRRSFYALSAAVKSTTTNVEDYIFPLPANVTPDANSAIHFFIKNSTTGVETQIFPNKFAFGTVSDTSTNPSANTFIFSSSTYAYYYTVMTRPLVFKSASDGTITTILAVPGTAVLSSPSFTFALSDVGKKVKIFDSVNTSNNVGTFDVLSDVNGSLTISFSKFVSETAVQATLVNASGTTISTIVDGIITPDLTDGTKMVFSSVALDFSTVPNLTTLNLVISIAQNAVNNGTFQVSGTVLANTHAITSKKFFITETPVTFEVFSPAQTGSFVVVNQSVVPANNALRITVIDARDVTFYDAGWLTALAALETVDIDIVVPLPKQTISAIFQNTVAHCRTMSNIKNKRERVAFIGAIQNLTPDNVLGNKLAAPEDIGILEGIQGFTVQDILSGNTEDLANYSVVSAYGTTFRAVYFYPDQIITQAGGSNVLVDGFYIAAAAAGYLCSVSNIAIPLTNKVLSGFSLNKNKRYSPTVLQNLLAAGITVCQPVAGGGLVIQGLTTTQSGFPEEQEISIIFIRDRIAKTFRSGFAGFIGMAENDTLLASLTSRAVGILNSFVSQGLISQFSDLKIARDSVDPRQWNISVRCQPTYPVNWIFIKVSVGTI